MSESFASYIKRTEYQSTSNRWKMLTPREQQVALLICAENGGKGYTNPQIAENLGISRETVKIHVRNILYKFNLHSKAELRRALNHTGTRRYDKF